jgi:hypothetical protein
VAAIRKYWLIRFVLFYPEIIGIFTVLMLAISLFLSQLTGWLYMLSFPGAWLLVSITIHWRVPDEFIADTYTGQPNRTNTGIISPVKVNNF